MLPGYAPGALPPSMLPQQAAMSVPPAYELGRPQQEGYGAAPFAAPPAGPYAYGTGGVPPPQQASPLMQAYPSPPYTYGSSQGAAMPGPGPSKPSEGQGGFYPPGGVGGAGGTWGGVFTPSSDFMSPDGDVEAQTAQRFAERTVRNGFVRKVFGFLSIQLAVTVGFAAVCMYVTPIKSYVRSTPWPFYLAWALALALVIVLSCSPQLRRKWPVNLYLLGAFTVVEAFLVGMITSFFDTRVVLMAFVTTAAIVLGLTIFACQTRFDVTGKGSYLLVLLVALVVVTLIGVFWVNTLVLLLTSGFGALVFGAFLVHDVQMLVGGRRYQLDPDEYVFAALSIYLDVVNLFLYLLQFLSLLTGGVQQ